MPATPNGTPPLASNAPAVGRFEQEVTSLENWRIEFSQSPIVFYGSSSIRRWKTLSQDFVGYPVVNCGFGGSRLSDCVRYVSRLVLRLKPVAVVMYAGDNDLAQGALPDKTAKLISYQFDRTALGHRLEPGKQKVVLRGEIYVQQTQTVLSPIF